MRGVTGSLIQEPLPACSTPAPAGCASPPPCSSTTSPASNALLPYDQELHVQDSPPAVHCDLLPDAMPRPSSLTAFSTAHSDNCVVGVSKSLTGHGRGHGVMDCGSSSVAGHQQLESANIPVSLCHPNCLNSLHVQPALVILD